MLWMYKNAKVQPLHKRSSREDTMEIKCRKLYMSSLPQKEANSNLLLPITSPRGLPRCNSETLITKRQLTRIEILMWALNKPKFLHPETANTPQAPSTGKFKVREVVELEDFQEVED